ncbi:MULTISPECIES: integrating conjugative element protein [Gallibacterium]|uniref:Conjugal transfer protein n=2 Tax=Gallibacterium TaxID=155493 RepID=A0AB36E3G4_9PAST|nr:MULTISPECIES: integrating conjugative element protein [Gallibacterium]OBW95826.1 conjugal transfer protein [Gallibacterium anatis]OBW98255.1 conjugal transfer protein [Gallibacterium anatis]OBX07510.1 conjugal transfer protein [Gallibacterium salpingitidis]
MRFLTIFFLLCYSITASALEVIADVGGESALRFYEPIQPVIAPNNSDTVVNSKMLPPTFHEKDLLPIVSHLMTVGKVSSRKMNLPTMQPIFLIGDDAMSETWLKQRLAYLTEISATGLVVNIKDYERLQQLRTIAKSVPLLPVSADDLAQRLKLTHYPVLITQKSIEQ